jgi:hypothetical protein
LTAAAPPAAAALVSCGVVPSSLDLLQCGWALLDLAARGDWAAIESAAAALALGLLLPPFSREERMVSIWFRGGLPASADLVRKGATSTRNSGDFSHLTFILLSRFRFLRSTASSHEATSASARMTPFIFLFVFIYILFHLY